MFWPEATCSANLAKLTDLISIRALAFAHDSYGINDSDLGLQHTYR